MAGAPRKRDRVTKAQTVLIARAKAEGLTPHQVSDDLGIVLERILGFWNSKIADPKRAQNARANVDAARKDAEARRLVEEENLRILDEIADQEEGILAEAEKEIAAKQVASPAKLTIGATRTAIDNSGQQVEEAVEIEVTEEQLAEIQDKAEPESLIELPTDEEVAELAEDPDKPMTDEEIQAEIDREESKAGGGAPRISLDDVKKTDTGRGVI